MGTYVNWRYYVPLCYIRSEDYQGALDFMTRNKNSIVLMSTSVPFLFNAAFCSLKLGHSLLDRMV
jgi:hypothetical protein